MNRTQRAIKKACHRAFDHAKREKRLALYSRNEAGWGDFGKKAEALKEAVRDEKSLKAWHRKMVQDVVAVNTSKEEKTA